MSERNILSTGNDSGHRVSHRFDRCLGCSIHRNHWIHGDRDDFGCEARTDGCFVVLLVEKEFRKQSGKVGVLSNHECGHVGCEAAYRSLTRHVDRQGVMSVHTQHDLCFKVLHDWSWAGHFNLESVHIMI